ncbi:MAG: cyanophycinase [Rubripirellula sp.]
MKVSTLTLIGLLCLVLSNSERVRGQGDEPSPKLVICGGGALPNSVFDRFFELAGPHPSLVVIPTASRRELDLDATEKLWRARGFEQIHVLHTVDRQVAATEEFVAPLQKATAVWIGGGSQQRIADAYLNTLVETELHALLQRGGVIGGSSAGAAIQSRVMIASGTSEPEISVGFDLLRGSVVDQHFLRRNRIPRLIAAIEQHPTLIGFGLDEGTAIVLCNEKLEVVGKSYVVRIESAEGKLKVDAYNEGDKIPFQVSRD